MVFVGLVWFAVAHHSFSLKHKTAWLKSKLMWYSSEMYADCCLDLIACDVQSMPRSLMNLAHLPFNPLDMCIQLCLTVGEHGRRRYDMEVILCYGGAGRGATQIEVRASEMRGKRRRCSRISGATGQRPCADERRQPEQTSFW